ncbi:hypothetical protein ACG904_20270 [Acinetobacter guillouiae]|uniref:hypothetical protein n=1 Tax=Acinetobacter guillouiae TaxID=106649 RepID=UPI003AF87136
MAEIITKQKLVEANENASAWEKYWAGGDDENVITRLNKIYPTHAKALKVLMENGGLQPFETQAQLLAYVPEVAPMAAKALDTKKVWLWKDGAWVDTGLSELDQAKAYTDIKTDILKLLKVGLDNNGLSIVDELTRIVLRISKNGELETALAKFANLSASILNITTKDKSDFAFSVVDDLGRIAFAVKKNGQILPSFSALSQGSYGIHVLSSTTTVDDINEALQKFKVVSLSPRSQITINKPIKIPNFGFLDFALSDIYLAPGSNCYILQNDDLYAGADLIMAKNGRLHGRASQQTRNYTDDFRNGYFGFGCAFSGVKNLQMENFYVEDTNGWGVAYLRCDTVYFKNFEFNQDEKRRGSNGDGITGQAKRIFIDGVKGFTNDDMIAVSNGKGTLQGYDIGVKPSECFDVEIVEIKNIHGSAKNGVPAYSGIGLYPTMSKTIKNVTVDGVTGEYDIHVWQITNYWPNIDKGYVGDVTINNISAKALGGNARVTFVDSLEHLTLNNALNHSDSTSKATLLIDKRSKINNLTIRNAKNIATDPESSASLIDVESQSKGVGLRKVILENCDVIKTTDAQKNALITAVWTSDAEPMNVTAINTTVDGVADDINAFFSSPNSEKNAKYHYIGQQKLTAKLELSFAWTGSALVETQSGFVSLSGLVKASVFTQNSVITTLPKLVRPASVKKYRLYSIEGDFNFIDITVNEVGEVRLIDSHASNSLNVFDLSNIKFSV